MARDGAEVVAVVDTAGGRALRVLEPRDGERIIVAGDRVVSSVMAEHNGICVSEVTGYDATTGEPVWGPAPYHLWGTDGVGCQQRTPPLGGGGALAALGPDGRPLVIDAYDGRVLWTGERDERVEDLSADRAVVRTGDGGNRYGVLLGGDGQRLWERPADPDAGVLLADCGVVVADRDPNRVYVWDPDTGEDRLSVATSARVLACAPDGVLIADGRSIGFARFPDAAPESSPDQPGTRGSEAPLTAK
jgi:outer membrane protein assembly factor BamB